MFLLLFSLSVLFACIDIKPAAAGRTGKGSDIFSQSINVLLFISFNRFSVLYPTKHHWQYLIFFMSVYMPDKIQGERF
jgi:hypothetical protein